MLDLPAGRRHNLRLRQWQIGRLLQTITDKAVLAGITVRLVDERGGSVGLRRPAPPPGGESLAYSARIHDIPGNPGACWWTPH